MKRKKRLIKWLILVLVLAATALLFLLNKGQESVSYREVPVTLGEITTYYNFDGLVHAPRTQTLAAGEAGTVRTVYVSQNSTVRKGDRIYRMDGGETVESDIDGEVTGLYVTEGDVIDAGETAARIVDMDRLEVRLDVDEYDVAAVTPGQKMTVSVLATGTQFDAQVSALDKNGTASGDLSYYTATVPMDAVEGVYPGMQVSAKMLREHVQDAAIMRVDALQFDEYNRPYVLVRRSAGAEPERVDVTIGVNDGVYCQIVSGVQAGDTVLTPSGMSLADMMSHMRQMQK